jgi:septum formation protein
MIRTNGKLILASQSPRRAQLLNQLGINFDVVPSKIEENYIQGESPLEFSERIARLKAQDVLTNYGEESNVWILSADTIVVCQGQILLKPKDSTDAIRMLSLLNGKTHKVITSYCIAGSTGKREKLESIESFVKFRKMDGKEIEWYVSTGEPLDKAGAYGAQGYGTIFIESIEGSYSNVVGLPLSQVTQTLIDFGIISFK